MSWEGIEEVLNRVRGELARVSLELADLDRNVAQRMLQGADLTGRTREQWEGAERCIHRLWTVHGAFEDTVEQACALHGSGGGGGSARDALSRMLTGDSVALPPRSRPPARPPDRCGADDAAEHVSLADAVARMSADLGEASSVVASVETAWEALHPKLGELEALWQEVGTLADMVGGDEGDQEALRTELASIGDTVRRDPLSLVEDDGTVDTSELEHARLRLEGTAGELRDALRMRDAYDESVQHLVWAVDDVEETVSRTAALRRRVAEAVQVPAPAAVADPVPALRAGVERMDQLRAQGRWRDLGTLHGRLQKAVHETVDDLAESGKSLDALLRRRSELRGRLDDYRARAVRLGLAEDERLLAELRRAHRALWRTPGDLREATSALAAYRDTLRRVTGHGTGSVRTTPRPGASEG